MPIEIGLQPLTARPSTFHALTPACQAISLSATI
jgi:hypothetical protein